jgi:hypothetical protein
MFCEAFEFVEQLGRFSNAEAAMVPYDVLAFSVDLLACSKQREGAGDFDGPRRKRRGARGGCEDESIYLVADLTREDLEETGRHRCSGAWLKEDWSPD